MRPSNAARHLSAAAAPSIATWARHSRVALLRVALSVVLSLGVALARAQVNVTTYHNDAARSGANTAETALTPSTVNSAGFGKLFSVPLDGTVYAQPLLLTNVSINGAPHTVLYVATEHDSLYAIDADSTTTTPTVLWQVSLIANGGSTVSGTLNISPSCSDIGPEIGITGTPVIDPSSGILYVVAKSLVANSALQYLHALNVATGTDIVPPVAINATVPGTGYDSINGILTFDPLLENQRAALLLTNGHVVIAWTSHCDTDPWHGWVMSYSASSLTQEAVWNTTPGGGEGGIWMSGAGPAADASGNIYFASGNGSADGVTNFADSIVKLGLTETAGVWSFAVNDYFTPYNQTTLATLDADLGSGGLVLLPTASNQTAALVQMSKQGTMYVLDQNNLGHFCAPTTPSCQNADSQILEEVPAATAGVWGAPAAWSNTVYWGGAGDPLAAYAVNPATGTLAPTPSSQSAQVFSYPGPVPSISANGSSGAILWAVDNAPPGNPAPVTVNPCGDGAGCQVLYAYDATNLDNLLYTSSQVPGRDLPGTGVKFATPTIANGRVYVGSQDAVSVYGLLPPTAPITQTPIASPSPGNYASPVSVTLADSTPNAVIYYTLDGSLPTTASAVYTVPLSITATTTVNAIAVAAGFVPSSSLCAAYLYETAPGISVDLASTFNSSQTFAITTDGTAAPMNHALDAQGDAFSAAQLGSTITWNGVPYALGSANTPSAASFTTIWLPEAAATPIASVNVLGVMVNNDTGTPHFTLSFADGTSVSYAQPMSGWNNPKQYAGESIVKTMPYYINASGAQVLKPAYVYGYSFAVPAGEIVQSIQLGYDPNVRVLAIDLIPLVTTGTVASTPPGQAASPMFSPAPGSFSTAQSVTLSTSTPGATIYYTVNGSMPTSASLQYTAPVTVGANSVLHAVAVASGLATSAMSSGEYLFVPATPIFSPPPGTYATAQTVTITTTAGAGVRYATNDTAIASYVGALAVCSTETLAAIAAAGGLQSSLASATYTIVPPATAPVQVNLAAVDNVYALGTFGIPVSGGGIDTAGSAYSAGSLERNETDCVRPFALGAPNTPSGVSAATIPLAPQGYYNTLSLLATAITGAQANQVFTVNYTDGTSAQFTQSLSNWNAPQNFAGEGIAATTHYKITATGAQTSGAFNLYYYSIPLNPAKAVQSLILPNNRDVVVLALDLAPATPPAVAPTFSEPSGSYPGVQTITLADATPGATLYFTTDGSAPSTNSTLYSAPITLSTTTTINAVAVANGYATSPVASVSITIVLPATPPPVISPPAQAFCGSLPIVIADAVASAAIYYTLDGSTPTSASALYTGPITISGTTTLNALAIASGDTPSTLATAAYVNSGTLSLAAPVFAPPPGVYASAQAVSLTDTTPGAAIEYAVVAPAATAFGPYTSPIAVAATTTLTAVATESGCANSAMVTAVYTIATAAPAATPTFSLASGSYTGAQTLAITDATAGAVIYYTLDGTVPTANSLQYSAPLTIAGTTTLNAIAIAPSASPSPVGTGTYIIGSAALSETVLHSFGSSVTDGRNPVAPLIQASNGNFYGTALYGGGGPGGEDGLGVLYSMTPEGSTATLYAFSPTSGADGGNPGAAAVEGRDGNFYGTTTGGGAQTDGTVFEFIPGTGEIVLHSFGSTASGDGLAPTSALMQASDGNFYGTTSAGGLYHAGTIFRYVAGIGEQVLYSFGVSAQDGAQPSSLVQGANGNFYGTTQLGGAHNDGTVFEFSLTQGETILYSFGSVSNDALYPAATLTFGNDGNWYGTATGGGSHAGGAIFTISAGGTESVVYAFGSGTDGVTPLAGLIQASDGYFYGTTQLGGANASGTVFRFSPTLGEQVIYSFGANPQDGAYPDAAVLEGDDANFYGTTKNGGASGSGTVFKLANVLVAAQTATPVFSPLFGSIVPGQTVSVSDATPNASIYYTLDGSTPSTTSSLYSGPITVIGATTINAVAIAPGLTPSPVATGIYTITPPAAAPTFSPAPGTYTSAQSVTLASTTPGAVIYYTTNGLAPGSKSSKYSTPADISGTTTLKAIAVANGYTNSAVATAHYTITHPAAAPTFSPAPGTYTSSQNVTLASPTPGAVIYYTTNGSAPGTSSTKYTTPVTISGTTTLKAIALATGYTSSAVATAHYTIPHPAAAPTFSPAPGTYTAAPTVTLASTTAGAVIYYTTNGLAPGSNSTTYTTPVTISGTTTLKAIAVATGYTTSAVATALYTITPPAAAPTFSPIPGTYPSAQSVAFSSATAGASIYYTTNGSTPTTRSTKYTTPVKIGTTTTLKAIGVAKGYSTSPVSTAVYTITPDAAKR